MVLVRWAAIKHPPICLPADALVASVGLVLLVMYVLLVVGGAAHAAA
jgi:hypothetical protein